MMYGSQLICVCLASFQTRARYSKAVISQIVSCTQGGIYQSINTSFYLADSYNNTSMWCPTRLLPPSQHLSFYSIYG